MTPSLERARYIGEQLAAVMDRLAVDTAPGSALLFLDLLARLEAWPAEEMEACGLRALVSEAAAARTEHATELGKLAGWAFDLDTLLEQGRHLPARHDDVGERYGWSAAWLRVATVFPWLTPARQRLTTPALDMAQAMIEADPLGFLEASALAADRWQLEHPESLGERARALLRTLDDVPSLAVLDAQASVAPDGEIPALADLDPFEFDAAEDALRDHAAGPATLAARGLRLAAAQERPVPLVRMQAGDWLISHLCGEAWLMLDVEGVIDGGAAAEIIRPDGVERLDLDTQRKVRLPDSTEGYWIRLRVGPDSRMVRLEPSRS
jgi:hypothetical protein